MPFRITELASELIICIIEQIEDRKTLQCLVLTSRTFRALTEPHLYRHNFLRTGTQAEALLRALESQPGRKTAVHSLDARCLYRRHDGLECLGQVLNVCPNLRDLVIESPFCNEHRWTKCAGMRWAEMLDQWMMPLLEATSLSGPAPSPRPLQNLNKRKLSNVPYDLPVVLHLNGTASHEYWHTAGTYASIFAHPSIQELHISSASLPDDALDLIPAGTRSPLKSLIFDQCNVSQESLRRVLAIPQALEFLHIGEVDGGERPMPMSQWYNLLADGDPPAFELALSQQQASLKSLYYASSSAVDSEQIRQAVLRKDQCIDLSRFAQLENIHIAAPCYQLERALITPASGPRCLKQLKIRGTYSTNMIRPLVTSNNTVQTQTREWSNYVLSVAKALPSLLDVEVVFGRNRLHSFKALPVEEVSAITAANSVLCERGGKLSVAVLHPHNRYVPPILYGEHMPAVIPVFETDKGFVWTPQILRRPAEQDEDEDDYDNSDLTEDDGEWTETEDDDEWTEAEGDGVEAEAAEESQD